MADLREAFASWGYQQVKTLQAAGNVVFTADETNIGRLTTELEQSLRERYGYEVPVIIRTFEYIRQLVEADPFKEVEVTPNTRLYVTFLAAKPESDLQIPYKSPDIDYEILSVSDGEVFSVLTLGSKGTTDAMDILANEFGNRITTRNWNTIVKIVTV